MGTERDRLVKYLNGRARAKILMKASTIRASGHPGV
jgi:hypothetical protein